MAQVAKMLFEKCEVPGLHLVVDMNSFAYMLNVRSDVFGKLTQLSKRMCNHCVVIHVVHIMFLSLFPRATVWFGHETTVSQGQ